MTIKQITFYITPRLAGISLWLSLLILIPVTASGANQIPLLDIADTPAEHLAELRSSSVLKPDSRVLHAVEELNQLKNNASPIIRFVQKGDATWEISGLQLLSQGQPALSDLPDFTQIKNYLNALLPSLGFKGSTSSGALPGISTLEDSLSSMNPNAMITLLQDLNVLSGQDPQNTESLMLAAKGLVQLAFTGYDILETGDLLQGKALAFLILAQAAGKEELLLEESMLAYKLGYIGHARQLLPGIDNQGWHHFLNQNDAELEILAQTSAPDSLEQYLWLKRLATADRFNEWFLFLTSNYSSAEQSIYAIATGSIIPNHDFRENIMTMLPFLVFGQVESDKNPGYAPTFLQTVSGNTESYFEELLNLVTQIPDLNQNGLLSSFEGKLVESSEQFIGPYIDTDSYRAYYRAYYFSALYKLGLHLLDNYNSINDSQTYSSILGSANSEVTQQLNTWFQNLVDAEKGNIDIEALLSDLNALQLFGTPPLSRTLETLLPSFPYNAPEKQKLVLYLAGRMDSRIGHRYEYANLASEHLLDLNTSEKLYLNLIQEDPETYQSTKAWLGQYFDRPDDIISVAKNASLTLFGRANALKYLSNYPSYEDFIWEQLEQLIRENPHEWNLYAAYFAICDEFDRHQRKIDMADFWLNQEHPNFSDFDHWKAVIAKAEALDTLGDTNEAWNTLEPIISSQYGPAMLLGVDLLIALNRLEDADELSITSIKRYPSSMNGLAARLKTLWVQRKFSEAAEIAGAWNHTSTALEWRWKVGPELLAALDKLPSGDSEQLVQSLQTSELESWKLAEFVVAASLAERYDIAYAFHSQLTGSGMGQLDIEVTSYRYLKELYGKNEARRQLEIKIPIAYRNIASMMFYTRGEFDLLWDLIPNPDSAQGAEMVWAFRAAATLEGYTPTPEQNVQLNEYYRSANNDSYNLLGKYVLGMVGADSIINTPMNSLQINESTYYLGLKALHENRYQEAIDWFRVSVNTAQTSSAEYLWSYNTLYLISSKNKNLAALDRDGGFSRIPAE